MVLASFCRTGIAMEAGQMLTQAVDLQSMHNRFACKTRILCHHTDGNSR